MSRSSRPEWCHGGHWPPRPARRIRAKVPCSSLLLGQKLLSHTIHVPAVACLRVPKLLKRPSVRLRIWPPLWGPDDCLPGHASHRGKGIVRFAAGDDLSVRLNCRGAPNTLVRTLQLEWRLQKSGGYQVGESRFCHRGHGLSCLLASFSGNSGAFGFGLMGCTGDGAGCSRTFGNGKSMVMIARLRGTRASGGVTPFASLQMARINTASSSPSVPSHVRIDNSAPV